MTNKSILVVEDNQTIRNFLVMRLADVGYAVSTAKDGEEGLESIRLSHPDLVVLDLRLPKMSGQEICKAVREDPNKAIASTPIIMLTALTSETDRVIGMVIGANRYLPKPFNPEELLKEIQACLSERQGIQSRLV